MSQSPNPALARGARFPVQFLAGRLASARFFGSHVLPECLGLVAPATPGAELLFSVDVVEG